MLIGYIKKSQFYFIFSFVILIFIGTLILKLPILKGGETLTWIDALFTATSAVCVTGLTTVSLANFTFEGQILVMLLIQLGGIGIMTMSGSILAFMGKNISWSDSKLLSNLTDNFSPHGVETMLKTIVCYTILVESLGMLLLVIGFLLDGFNIFDSLWLSLFHSVSAFCNAGFSPLPDNLIGRSAFIKVVISFLIILGGFGMYAVYDIFHAASNRAKHLKVNTKLILITSIALIIIGAILIKFSQSGTNNQIAWIDAYFQSVSARTAGFNTVDLSLLHSNSLLVLIALMLIGGSPGSTAGGMKVTTFALVCIAIYNTFIGNQKVILFKREINMSDILKSFTIAITFILLCCLGAAMYTAMSNSTLQGAFFEISSAIGTVGLSIGDTMNNTFNSKLLTIFFMFLGRVGPLTMFLFLMEREKQSHLIYPEEKIVIG